MREIVFDTWPLIAFFEEESSATEVENMLLGNRARNAQMSISAINLREIWYTVARAHSKNDADQTLAEIKQIGI